jgi:hypothetical protein
LWHLFRIGFFVRTAGHHPCLMLATGIEEEALRMGTS